MGTRAPHSRYASSLRAPFASLTQQNRRLLPKIEKNHVSEVTLCPDIEPPSVQIVGSECLCAFAHARFTAEEDDRSLNEPTSEHAVELTQPGRNAVFLLFRLQWRLAEQYQVRCAFCGFWRTRLGGALFDQRVPTFAARVNAAARFSAASSRAMCLASSIPRCACRLPLELIFVVVSPRTKSASFAFDESSELGERHRKNERRMDLANLDNLCLFARNPVVLITGRF
jgi:hypothetical protein